MKMYAVAEALFTPLLIKNIKDESGSMKTGMWKLQALMHIPLAALALQGLRPEGRVSGATFVLGPRVSRSPSRAAFRTARGPERCM